MADEKDPEPAQPGAGPGGAGGSGEPDYKALYEASIRESRKWEERAKSNAAAAKKLDELKGDKPSAEEKIADLEKRLNDKERAEDHAKLAAFWSSGILTGTQTGTPFAKTLAEKMGVEVVAATRKLWANGGKDYIISDRAFGDFGKGSFERFLP